MLNEALRLNKLGFRVIPVDDKKRPTCKGWKKYQETQTQEDIKNLFSSSTYGIALLTGIDGIEVIDIDSKYALDKTDFETKVFDAIIEVVGVNCFQSLILSQTQSGGYHLIYKSDKIEGNQKLASRPTLESERKTPNDKVRVLLETRGENGYILIPPSPNYEFDLIGANLEHIPTITDRQRDSIIRICRTFDEVGTIYRQTAAHIPLQIQSDNKTTIEAFNEAHTPIELIEQAGWQFAYTRGQDDYFVRPGKQIRDGISAGYNHEKGLLYVFTTSSSFDSERAYNAFQTFSFLNHNGDYKAAAKELYNMNYGDRVGKQKDSHKEKLTAIAEGNEADNNKLTDSALMESIFVNNFNINIKPKIEPATLFMQCSETGKWQGIGGDGEIITFCGLQKSGKSSVASCAASCFLVGGSNNSLKFKTEGQTRNLIHLDTEQGEYDYWTTSKQMLWQQGLDQNAPNLYSYRLTNYTLSQKLQYLDYVVKRVGNVGCVFLDGVVDLCQDYNDQKESRALIEYIRRLGSVHGFLLINVLHNARSTGKARGHLGTELLNKGKCNINITKDKEMGCSKLDIEDLRGGREPKGFCFKHTEEGNIILDGL